MKPPAPWKWDRHPDGDFLECEGYSLSWGIDGTVCFVTPDAEFRVNERYSAPSLTMTLHEAGPLGKIGKRNPDEKGNES